MSWPRRSRQERGWRARSRRTLHAAPDGTSANQPGPRACPDRCGMGTDPILVQPNGAFCECASDHQWQRTCRFPQRTVPSIADRPTPSQGDRCTKAGRDYPGIGKGGPSWPRPSALVSIVALVRCDRCGNTRWCGGRHGGRVRGAGRGSGRRPGRHLPARWRSAEAALYSAPVRNRTTSRANRSGALSGAVCPCPSSTRTWLSGRVAASASIAAR